MIEWGFCETKKDLCQLISGRRIYIFVKKNKGGGIWIRITRHALLLAMSRQAPVRRYNCKYKLVDKFAWVDYKSILFEL